MEGSGPLLLSCLSLLISCLFYHSLSHKTNNTKDVLLWELVSLSQSFCFPSPPLSTFSPPSPLSSLSYFYSEFQTFLNKLFFLFIFSFHLLFWPSHTCFFSFLFTFFLPLDDFPVNRCTCSQSTSCYNIL